MGSTGGASTTSVVQRSPRLYVESVILNRAGLGRVWRRMAGYGSAGLGEARRGFCKTMLLDRIAKCC
jgi:hypothetical protein